MAMISDGVPVAEIAARRLAAARLIFRAGVDAAVLCSREGLCSADRPEKTPSQVMEPLRLEDPFVLEALRLDWGSRAAIGLMLTNAGLPASAASSSIIGRTIDFPPGPVHGPLFRPSQPQPRPVLPNFPHAFAAQQAFVRYLHAVVYPKGPKQLGEHDPGQAAWEFVEHLIRWDEAAEVLTYDEVTRDAFAWPLGQHPDVMCGLAEVDNDVATVLAKSPVLRSSGHDLGPN